VKKNSIFIEAVSIRNCSFRCL